MLRINNKECIATGSQTILDVAVANNVYIPTLCHKNGLAPSGACGICVVEVEGSPRLLRACATPATSGMVIHTDSFRVLQARKELLQLLLSTHTGDCVAPCRLSCPAETDCRGYISLIREGKTDEAVKLMKEAHPFPASVARICPRFCEESCRRALVDEAVSIAALKRFAADRAVKYIPEILPDTGKTIAIIGGGPAGLTAAYFLRRAGQHVYVYEEMPKMGGLLRYGIPEYRLPKAVLDAELSVLQEMGINFCNNTALGTDVFLTELQKKFDAVIIALGARASKPLRCKGDEAVIGGTDFLKAIASGNAPDIMGKKVVIIGGSNTAMDAARTSIRLGANVLVSYRRTRDEMTAEQFEIDEAIAEGVEFLFLTAPQEVNSTGIILQKMALGEPDESGRRRPVPLNVSELIEADMVVSAIGQDIIMSGLDPLVNLETNNEFKTHMPGVYAIGDATGKSPYAIDAIAHGRKVAASVLQNIDLPWDVLPKILVKDETPTCLSGVETEKRQRGTVSLYTPEHVYLCNEPVKEQSTGLHTATPTMPVAAFAETHQNLTPSQALQESARCLSCGCDAFDKCQLLKLSNTYNAKPTAYNGRKPTHKIDDRNRYIRRDINKCVHCYLCVRICKSEADVLTATHRGFESTISTAFGTPLPHNCQNCNKCVTHCPTGALF